MKLTEANIEKLNAPLYIDVACYRCGKRIALSNSHEENGRRYCDRCILLVQGVEEAG